MTILNELIKKKYILVLLCSLLIFIGIYRFIGDYNRKNINYLDIKEFYKLRVDTSVDDLIEIYGEPTRIVNNYNEVLEMLNKSIYESDYEYIDINTCKAIFINEENRKKFYDIATNPVGLEEYSYTFYDKLNHEKVILIYVKSSKVVGVTCF